MSPRRSPRETRLKGTRRPWPDPRPLLAPGGMAPPALPALEARLLVVTGEEHCTGPWAMPPRVAVKALWSELVLDLREATLQPEGWLDVDALMAQVRIVLPPGVRVTFAVHDWLGDAKDEREPAPPAPDAPHLIITGSVWFAELRVRDR